MRRGLRRGAPLGEGFLDDYALAGLGLLRMHAADGDLAWLAQAQRIAAALVERFDDPARGVLVQAPLPPGPRVAGGEEDGLPLHRPDVDDGVLPSGSSAAALFLVEIGAIAGDEALSDRGLEVLREAAARMRASPFSSGFFLVGIDHATGDAREVVIAGDPSDPRTRALVAVLAPTTDARVLPVLLPAVGLPESLARCLPRARRKGRPPRLADRVRVPPRRVRRPDLRPRDAPREARGRDRSALMLRVRYGAPRASEKPSCRGPRAPRRGQAHGRRPRRRRARVLWPASRSRRSAAV